MDTIDLDAILTSRYLVIENGKTVSAHTHLVKNAMREAIHQALVLASENAKSAISTNPDSDIGIKKRVEQSILDVEKLIKDQSCIQ